MTTNTKNVPPWTTGPGELLRHGRELLAQDTDSSRRLGMIAIDNAVELTLKTYLGLPKRITGIRIPRKELSEITESFPLLLDAVEKYSSEKIAGIDLGDIEWYHRLRNQLYHQGNGLTIEAAKVSAYAELANLLFERLFGVSLIKHKEPYEKLFAEYLKEWSELQFIMVMNKRFEQKGEEYKEVMREINYFGDIRNKLVHGNDDPGVVLNRQLIGLLKTLKQKVLLLSR